MGLLIDSSVLLDLELERVDLGSRVEGREDEDLLVSVVTASELLHGVHRARTPAQRQRRSAWVEALLERLPILPIDLVTARAHARIWAELAAQGTIIGAHDLWLAATCIAHGLSLATTNEREFRRVPGLSLENWSARAHERGSKPPAR